MRRGKQAAAQVKVYIGPRVDDLQDYRQDDRYTKCFAHSLSILYYDTGDGAAAAAAADVVCLWMVWLSRYSPSHLPACTALEFIHGGSPQRGAVGAATVKINTVITIAETGMQRREPGEID